MSSSPSACHLIGPQNKMETRCPCPVNLWSAKLLSDKHYCRKETCKLRLLWVITLLVVNNIIKIHPFQTDASGKVNMNSCPSLGVWLLQNSGRSQWAWSCSRSGCWCGVSMVKPEQHVEKLPSMFLKLQEVLLCCTWLNILEFWGGKGRQRINQLHHLILN